MHWNKACVLWKPGQHLVQGKSVARCARHEGLGSQEMAYRNPVHFMICLWALRFLTILEIMLAAAKPRV